MENALVTVDDKSTGKALAFLPTRVDRYTPTHKVPRIHRIIARGGNPPPSFTELSAWSQLAHPEGNTYNRFHCEGSLDIITQADVFDQLIRERIVSWATRLEQAAAKQHVELGGDVELFLELSGDGCHYYFAEWSTRKIFWLEELSTEELGLSGTISDSHLDRLLLIEFFQHVENYCSHRPLAQEWIDDLILVFTHAVSDLTTSQGNSTFAFGLKESERHLNLLRSVRDQCNKSQVVCMVGRVWHMIEYARYEVHFGEKIARLSTDVSVLETGEPEEFQWTKGIASMFTFGVSRIFNDKLDLNFTDHVVFDRLWSKFIESANRTWLISLVVSLFTIFFHALFWDASPVLLASVVFSVLATITAIPLLLRFHHSSATADPVNVYLQATKLPYLGHQLVALSFALPSTFASWSFLFTLVHYGYLAFENLDLWLSVTIVASVAVVFILSNIAISTTSFFIPLLSCLRPAAPPQKSAEFMV